MESVLFYRLGIPVPWLLFCCALLLFPPVDWWTTYAIGCPLLQCFAIRILGLTCSASNCERNWSTFERPLTELPDNKCKRCGLYEQDTLKSDDVFDEWELWPDDFLRPDGRCIHFKGKEFNATFLCPQCLLEHGGHESNPPSMNTAKHGNAVFLVVLVVALSCCLCAFMGIVIYKYWQKRKREQDQARFSKAF